MGRVAQSIRNNPALFSILLLAFLVRFAGIFHDLPYSYYPDEEHFVNRAVSFGSGDMNPHWFHKPAFFMYLLYFEYGFYFIIGKIMGLFGSVNDFAISFFRSKGPFLLIARFTVTLFGVGTVLVTYFVGRDGFDKKTGLIAALFMALVFGHVSSSQVVKADVPSAFFTVLAFYYILKMYSTGRLKYYILSGALIGLGMATKYYSIVLLPTVFIAHFLYWNKSDRASGKNPLNWAIVSSMAAFIIVFFLASPYNFLDPLGFEQTFVRPVSKILDLQGKMSDEFLRRTRVEVQNFVFLKSLKNYILTLVNSEAMGELGIIAVFGIIVMIFRLSSQKIMFLSFPIIFILISNKMQPFYSESRHMNVIYPFMAVFGAYVTNRLLERLSTDRKAKWIIITVVLIIVAFPFYRIIKHDFLMIHSDARTLAKKWIETNIPVSTKILLEENSVKLSPDRNYYEELVLRARNSAKGQFTAHAEMEYEYSMKALPKITYDITYIRFPWWQEKEINPGIHYALSEIDKDMGNPLKPVGIMPYHYYGDHGYSYVIVSSNKYDKFFEENSDLSDRFPSFHRFYNDLFEKARLIKEFVPDNRRSRGPAVKIFALQN